MKESEKPQTRFKQLLERASQPLPSIQEKQRRDDSYSDTQTRSRKVEDTLVKRSDTSRPGSASADPKSPQ
jgi:hypothetical protein